MNIIPAILVVVGITLITCGIILLVVHAKEERRIRIESEAAEEINNK